MEVEKEVGASLFFGCVDFGVKVARTVIFRAEREAGGREEGRRKGLGLMCFWWRRCFVNVLVVLHVTAFPPSVL